MSYLKDREVWLEKTPTGNPPAEYYWKFIQDGVVVVRDSDGVDKKMVAKTSDTGAAELPVGTSAQRPITPAAGMIRFNTDRGLVEWYDDITDNWLSVAFDVGVSATGGTVTDIELDGQLFRVHTFTSDGTFDVTRGGDVEYLVVAGGGSGGARFGAGGGGAGGLLQGSEDVSVQNYTVVIGQGGALIPSSAGLVNGNDGENSSFAGHVSIGGGGGASGYSDTSNPGRDGGSGGGGGAASNTASGARPGGSGTAGQGNDGGAGLNFYGSPYAAGGGGGAGSAGNSPNIDNPNGGDGLISNITGSSVAYAGGGGGGSQTTMPPGIGGSGVGGNAGPSAASGNASPGAPNTGSGGGGLSQSSGNQTGNSGQGGSGIVIVRYRIG